MTPLMFVSAMLSAFLDILMILLFLRALLSWMPLEEDNALIRFLYVLTEPALIPIRSLFERMGWFENLPIDMSFSATVLLLGILRTLLSLL